MILRTTAQYVDIIPLSTNLLETIFKQNSPEHLPETITPELIGTFKTYPIERNVAFAYSIPLNYAREPFHL